jgi:hypothetical protein
MSRSSSAKKMRWVGRMLLVPVLWIPVASLAGGTLNLQDLALYEKGMPVPDAVRAECGLEGKVVEFVQTAAARNFDKVVLVPDGAKAGAGQSLAMKITGITGTAGGAWSGAKFLTIDGTLRENGKVIGTFRATRASGGGAFGGYKGTCSILGRCAKTLGDDVAKWLAAPTMNAKLGDER